MDAISAYSSQQIWTTEEIGYLETARNLEKNAQAMQSGSMPAVNVVLSPESLEAAAQHNAKVFAKQLDGTAADGTAVTVQRNAGIYSSTPDIQDGYIKTDTLEGYIYGASFTDAKGNAVNVEFTGDIRSAQNADGNRSVYFSETNTTRTYAADGSYVEEEGDRIAEDADSVYISTSGSAVTTGNGNNLIFAYGDNATIQGGAGNDTVRLADSVSNVKINTGSGDDSVSGTTVYGAEITLNDGNNTVSLRNATGSDISAGNGDNTLNITQAADTAIALGNGNNAYTGYGLSKGSSLVMGDGSNSVDLYEVGQSGTRMYAASNASVSLGNGDNAVKIYQAQNGSNVTMGNGNNTVNLHEVATGSALNVGHGNNNLNVYEVIEGSALSVGNGNNNLLLYGIESGSKVAMGNGDNRAKVYEVEDGSYLGFGNGNNALELYSLYDSLLEFGDGDNDTGIYATRGNSTLRVGNGNNLIQIDNAEDASKITVGDGENAFYLGNSSAGVSITDSSGNSFDSGRINSLMQQGLWGSLLGLNNARTERQEQGTPTLSDIRNDDFFNTGFNFSGSRNVTLPSKAEVEAMRSYAKASLQSMVPLTHTMLPESVSRYMTDAGVLDGTSYSWRGSSSGAE